MFDHGQNTAQKTAKTQLLFAKVNIVHLRKEDPKGKHEEAVNNMYGLTQKGSNLSDRQLSYVNDIYELTMKGLGLPACERLRKPRFNELKH